MADPKRQLSRDYVCPKCRGRQPDVRDVALAKSRLFGFLPARDSRYIEVTCTLCGYTEFYNRAIYVKTCAAEKASEKIPLPEKADGR